MPTYEYIREDGTIFEYRQGINDERLKTCPETGQNVKRMISGGAGVVYKGEGWYVTDYKNTSSQPINGSSENAESNSNSEIKAGQSESAGSGD
jgi:putative FmdB family regulatory protein